MRSASRTVLPILVSLGVGGLAGCPHPALGQNDQKTQDVTGILERIRQDVGHYELQAAGWRGIIGPKTADPAMPPPPFAIACPKSLVNYDFDVTKIELALEVVATNTATADVVGLKVPIGGASLGLDLNGSIAKTQTKTIVLDRIPTNDLSELRKYRDGQDYANLTRRHQAFLSSHSPSVGENAPPPVFPISDMIIGLRKSLLEASGKLPCFDTANGEAVGHSIKFEFEVDKAVDPTLGFTFLIVTAKADDKIQNQVNNTITITVAPHAKPGAKK
jgi:hypothetical protein